MFEIKNYLRGLHSSFFIHLILFSYFDKNEKVLCKHSVSILLFSFCLSISVKFLYLSNEFAVCLLAKLRLQTFMLFLTLSTIFIFLLLCLVIYCMALQKSSYAYVQSVKWKKKLFKVMHNFKSPDIKSARYECISFILFLANKSFKILK